MRTFTLNKINDLFTESTLFNWDICNLCHQMTFFFIKSKSTKKCALTLSSNIFKVLETVPEFLKFNKYYTISNKVNITNHIWSQELDHISILSLHNSSIKVHSATRIQIIFSQNTSLSKRNVSLTNKILGRILPST